MKTQMTDTALKNLIEQVRRNCDISDAQGAGLFSICGLALRLRDLHKWEKKLAPWQERNSAQISGWIEEKETLWDQLADIEPFPLDFGGRTHDPFDTLSVNKSLSNTGLFYGAGYAHSLKPTFFLAEINEHRNVNGVTVHILGRELARDLLTIPALNQDQAVVVRQDAARMFLWDQMAYLKKSGRPALDYALSCCGLPDCSPRTLRSHFEAVVSAREPAYIDHELGEMADTVFNRTVWQELVARFPHTTVELLARAVKDLLADTGPKGTLAGIIRKKNRAGLGFYAAFIDGLIRSLFPELRESFGRFVRDPDWEEIEKARLKGFEKAKSYAEKMMDIYEDSKNADCIQNVHDKIHTDLVLPLLP